MSDEREFKLTPKGMIIAKMLKFTDLSMNVSDGIAQEILAGLVSLAGDRPSERHVPAIVFTSEGPECLWVQTCNKQEKEEASK